MELLRDPDAELIAACRRVDSDAFEQAFEQLFLKYRDRVHAIAYRITGSTVDAMDVVQESFSLLFRKLDSFRSDSLFSTWLFRMVVNCSIDHRRRERTRSGAKYLGTRHAFDSMADEPMDPADGPDRHSVVRETGDQVQQAIQMLSPKLRAILALRYLEEMSYEEIAVTLAISLGTVKSRLARAHLAMEKVLRESFPALRPMDAGGSAAEETA
ncbi:MAG: hypothetical protein RL148_2160 [Planctomycetota bacterium]